MLSEIGLLPELLAMAVVLVVLAAEVLHALRITQIARLAFGPGQRPASWVYAIPLLRSLALGGFTWGVLTLLSLTPKTHRAGEVKPEEIRRLLLVLDVSPSMKLQDAGPLGKQRRDQRAADLLQSFFERVQRDRYRTTIVATFTGAKPVVQDTTDLEVVRNVLNDLPLAQAFEPGPTNLFAGLAEAAKLAAPWPPESTVLLFVSDGDTIPPLGMPRLPASIKQVVVIGVGDQTVGKSIEGHQSRQDASALRQLAARLNGTYHNGNEKHLPTEMVTAMDDRAIPSWWDKLTRREYALLAIGFSSVLLGFLPFALQQWGSSWKPGIRYAKATESLEMSRT
ncbi:MAG: VWA domain-containing protein [Planctomycetia bacterium]|nr:VWA domain-containing protein [Planctomycetia bacterium]